MKSCRPEYLMAALLLTGGCSLKPDDTRLRDADWQPAASIRSITAPEIRREEGLTTVEIVRMLAPSIVRVQTENASLSFFRQGTPSVGMGTGVIFDNEGNIVTNNHVITSEETNRPADRIIVTLSDQRTLRARIVGRDQATDLAVLRVNAAGLTPATFGNPDELLVGQDVVAIGFALDLMGAPTVTHGVISAINRVIQERTYTIPEAIQTDAGINPGNSGGPLVNGRGEVIGINTAIVRSAQNIGFSISVSLVRPILEALVRDGRIERSFLGVATLDVTPSVARNFGLATEKGIAITYIAKGSPASQAGLRENDVLIRIAGMQVTNNGELLAVLAKHRPGATVTIEFYRGAGRRRTEATLAEHPGS